MRKFNKLNKFTRHSVVFNTTRIGCQELLGRRVFHMLQKPIHTQRTEATAYTGDNEIIYLPPKRDALTLSSFRTIKIPDLWCTSKMQCDMTARWDWQCTYALNWHCVWPKSEFFDFYQMASWMFRFSNIYIFSRAHAEPHQDQHAKNKWSRSLLLSLTISIRIMLCMATATFVCA